MIWYIFFSVLALCFFLYLIKPAVEAYIFGHSKDMKLASAGSAEKDKSKAKIRLSLPYFKNDMEESVYAADYETFLVDGDSMSRFDLTNGSIVFADKFTADDLKKQEPGRAPVLVLKTDGSKKIEYKLRKFRGMYDFINDFNDWLKLHPELDGEALKTKFTDPAEQGKINECRQSGYDLLISETTIAGKPAYSFHPSSRIKGRVRYALPNDKVQILEKY